MHHDASFELRIGAERIEVIVDAWGIRFRHPDGEGAQGLLPWSTALALSLLPPDRGPGPRANVPPPRG